MVNYERVWEGIPLPALTVKTLNMYKEGVYIIRTTERRDIFLQPYYTVEVRSVFGMYDEFAYNNSLDFKDKAEAMQHVAKVLEAAEQHYIRLKEKQRRRIENGKN